MYFAILLDRKSAGTIMIGCSEGGTSIEDLAEKYPDKIIKVRGGCTWHGTLRVPCAHAPLGICSFVFHMHVCPSQRPCTYSQRVPLAT